MRGSWTVAAGAAACVLLGATGSAPAAQPELNAKAAKQIAALQKIKRSLTPAERKLDSRLVVTLRRRADKAATRALPRLKTGVDVSSSDRTEVDVQVAAVTTELLERLERVGARVRSTSKPEASLRAAIPMGALKTVARWGDVHKVAVADEAVTHRAAGAPVRRESKEAKARRLEAQLDEALESAPAPLQGDVISEGDKAHAADTARATTRVTGTGVKVCALSDGVDSLAASQAAGELPDIDVLPGQAGDGDEGTAMLEIIHDLAPRAELGFATAFTSAASFADNIRALRSEAGCDVLVDDILWLAESPFQDGPIAQAVNAVTADGALYFSAAGNAGNTIDGTSGNYEGDFVDSGQGVGKFAGAAHDFDPGPSVQILEPLSSESVGVPLLLFWADALGVSRNDYDLYALSAAGNVVEFSQDVQNGDDNPFEGFLTPTGGLRAAVVKYAGDARYFRLTAFRGRFENSADGLTARFTPGVTWGHSAAVNAFSSAAAPADEPLPFDLEPGDPANPVGPFPLPFTGAQAPERFTSDGPRRVFFNADGSPITPGNYSSTGGAVRQKPDFTGADGVLTSVDGFDPFFGTSAAAPHLAAIAALVLSGNPGTTNAELRDAFATTALDLAPAGIDARTGRGVVRADLVLAETGATPQPLARAVDPVTTPVTDDGDAFLEPGEAGDLVLPVTNEGDGTATGVSVRVTSGDARLSVSPRTSAVGDLAAGETRPATFRAVLAEDHPLGKPIPVNVRTTFAGVLSPTYVTLQLPIGEPAATPTRFAYAGPPVAIPDNSTLGASVTIPVVGVGYAHDLTFSIDGEACTAEPGATTVGLDHTYVGDLAATLTAPDGRTVTLFERDGGGGNNLCRTVFDDSAAVPFSVAVTTNAPYTGSWLPQDPLAPLLSEAVDGDWTFKVIDAAARDTGSIRAVSLHITGFVADATARRE